MVPFALAIVYLVWGSTYLAIAYAVQTLPPLFAAGARFLVAGGLLGLWIAARDARALRVTRGQLLAAGIVGVLLLAGGNGLLSVSEQTVPSGLAALIVATIPLWIVVIRAVTGEHVRSDLLVGVGVGLLGVAVLVLPGGLSGEIDRLGSFLLIAASFSWALGTFLSPRVGLPRSPLVSTALQMLVAGVVLLVVATLRGELGDVHPDRVATESIVGLAYLVVFGSIIAFSAYTWLLQHASVSLVSTYAFVNPVVAVGLGTLIRHEPLTPTTLAGAALIVAAVAWIVTRPTAVRSR